MSYSEVMRVAVTKSALETKKFAARLAATISAPAVIALAGELGAGKTTFVQGFAKALGVKEKIQSPTFVLLKIYNIYSSSSSRRHTKESSRLRPNSKISGVRHLVHIDCYRLNSPRDMAHVGFKNLLQDKDAVILVEWAGRIKSLLPKSTLRIKFKHGKRSNERIISLGS